MASVKSNRINVKNLVYALLTSDDSTGVTYGNVKSLAKAMTVQITPSQSSGVLYGDGAQEENIAKLTGLACALEVNKVSIENKAEIMGHTYENGVMIVNKADQAPNIALGFQIEGTNGYSEYVWLLKGRAQEGNQNASQATDNINFTTDNLTINFVPREYDGLLEFLGDSSNSDLYADQIAAWFSVGPESYPRHSTSTTTD